MMTIEVLFSEGRYVWATKFNMIDIYTKELIVKSIFHHYSKNILPAAAGISKKLKYVVL
jgi:hypothetical protein